MALAVSTQSISSIVPTSSLQAALRLFEAELTKEQSQYFRQSTSDTLPSDVVVFISEIDAANQSSRSSASSRLFTFLEAAQQFVSVVDTFVSSNPTIAALIWRGIKTSIVIANNNLPYFDKVTAMIRDIGRWSPTYTEFGQLYRHDSQVQTALCDYYAVVIQICTKVVQLHSRTSQLLPRFFSSFESDFKPLLDELEKQQKHFQVRLHLSSHKVIVEEQKANKLSRRVTSRFQSFSLRAQEQTSRSLADNNRRQILDNLSTLKPRESWSIIHAQRVVGTADWFCNDAAFVNWYRGNQTSVLWCSGMLGVGKSVLTSSIIAYLECNRRSDHHISYHFCQTGHETTLTAKGALGSIAHQLLRGFMTQIHGEPLKNLLERSEDMSVEDLIGILEMHLEPNGDHNYFIILDGLDECSEDDVSTICSQIQRLSQNSRFCIKVLYSCRPDLESILKRCLQYNAKLVLTQDVLQPDIEKYIDATLQRCVDEDKLRLGNLDLLVKIAEVLESNCHGMLLWLSLFIEELCYQNSDAAILEMLEHPPEGIKELYDGKLARIQAHKFSRESVNVLRYVGVARRPLTIDEMREALSVSPEQRELDPQKLPNDMDRILRACSGLIHIDEGTETLRFVHASLRSHLFSEHHRQQEDFEQAELHFSSICMTYLNFTNFTQQVTRTSKEQLQIRPLDSVLSNLSSPGTLSAKLTQKVLQYRRSRASMNSQQFYNFFHEDSTKGVFHFTFFAYASDYWLQHTQNLFPAKGAKFWEIFHRCVENKNLNKCKPWLFTANDPKDSLDIADAAIKWAVAEEHDALVVHQTLYEASNMGSQTWRQIIDYALGRSNNFFDTFVQSGLIFPGIREYTRSLMMATSDGSHPQSLKVYFTTEADEKTVDLDGKTLLHQAVVSGPLFLVKLLLAARFDVTVADKHGETLLHSAITRGNGDIAELLVTAGADVNLANGAGNTPLHFASLYQRREIVRMLLTAGAEVNAVNHHQETPLHLGSFHCDLRIRQMLLTAGADANFANSAGETPLHLASAYGRTEVVQMLLTAGADVNTTDCRGQTPLHAAIHHGRTEATEVLLEAGADVDAADIFGRKPLHLASIETKAEVARILLVAGARTDAIDDSGRTPLGFAAMRQNDQLIPMLVAAKADIIAVDESLWQTIQHAVRDRDAESSQKLPASGAEM